MKFKIAITVTITKMLELSVRCRMHCLVVGLLAIQCIIERTYSMQYNTDINQIIKYLQKQNQKESVNNDGELYTRNSNLYSPHKHSINHRGGEENASSDTEITQSGLEKLFDLLNNKQQSKSRKPIHKDSKNNEEYSKVYLVLDPQAKINAADVKRIGEIVSSLISGKGRLETKPPTKKQPRRYKGFVLMDDFFARRRNKESKEIYPMDSIERDYKPKRARNEYAGAGRTAIPYKGHRGDIYEKE